MWENILLIFLVWYYMYHTKYYFVVLPSIYGNSQILVWLYESFFSVPTANCVQITQINLHQFLTNLSNCIHICVATKQGSINVHTFPDLFFFLLLLFHFQTHPPHTPPNIAPILLLLDLNILQICTDRFICLLHEVKALCLKTEWFMIFYWTCWIVLFLEGQIFKKEFYICFCAWDVVSQTVRAISSQTMDLLTFYEVSQCVSSSSFCITMW